MAASPTRSAGIVLAIVALAGVNPGILVPVAVIVFGAALLVQGGTILSEHAPPGWAHEPVRGFFAFMRFGTADQSCALAAYASRRT
jgi:hypothetical protein